MPTQVWCTPSRVPEGQRTGQGGASVSSDQAPVRLREGALSGIEEKHDATRDAVRFIESVGGAGQIAGSGKAGFGCRDGCVRQTGYGLKKPRHEALSEGKRSMSRAKTIGGPDRNHRLKSATRQHTSNSVIQTVPKYRGPAGETWLDGRGRTPRWVTATGSS